MCIYNKHIKAKGDGWHVLVIHSTVAKIEYASEMVLRQMSLTTAPNFQEKWDAHSIFNDITNESKLLLNVVYSAAPSHPYSTSHTLHRVLLEVQVF